MDEPDAAQFDPNAVGLFLDVDGTLIEFAPTPDSVTVPLSLLEELAAVEARLGGALALVSGRSIRDLDTLFSPLSLRASGVHGGEIRFDPVGEVSQIAPTPLPDQIWNNLQDFVKRFPGVYIENKRYSFAIHYRLATVSAIEVRSALQQFVRQIPEWPLEIATAHLVYELKLPGVDKGGAIEHFMARPPFSGRTPIFIADDTIDQPGVDKVNALGGIAYSVGPALTRVSGWFSRPKAVRAWLGRLGR